MVYVAGAVALLAVVGAVLYFAGLLPGGEPARFGTTDQVFGELVQAVKDGDLDRVRELFHPDDLAKMKISPPTLSAAAYQACAQVLNKTVEDAMKLKGTDLALADYLAKKLDFRTETLEPHKFTPEPAETTVGNISYSFRNKPGRMIIYVKKLDGRWWLSLDRARARH